MSNIGKKFNLFDLKNLFNFAKGRSVAAIVVIVVGLLGVVDIKLSIAEQDQVSQGTDAVTAQLTIFENTVTKQLDEVVKQSEEDRKLWKSQLNKVRIVLTNAIEKIDNYGERLGKLEEANENYAKERELQSMVDLALRDAAKRGGELKWFRAMEGYEDERKKWEEKKKWKSEEDVKNE